MNQYGNTTRSSRSVLSVTSVYIVVGWKVNAAGIRIREPCLCEAEYLVHWEFYFHANIALIRNTSDVVVVRGYWWWWFGWYMFDNSVRILVTGLISHIEIVRDECLRSKIPSQGKQWLKRQIYAVCTCSICSASGSRATGVTCSWSPFFEICCSWPWPSLARDDDSDDVAVESVLVAVTFSRGFFSS